MKVNPNHEVPRAVPISSETKLTARFNAAEKTEFTSSTDLTKKLATTPDIRADEVARARALITDPNYPDAKTVRAVACQLVDNIQSPDSTPGA